MKLLVTGAYGFLGSALCPELEWAGHAVYRQGRGVGSQVRCDPAAPCAFSQVLREISPDVVINLIANTDVDQCETNPSVAFDANVRVMEAIVQVLADLPDTHLVHVSTDQVYDGPGPHYEDMVAPCNVYAITKYAGELAAEKVAATILRTNFVGRGPWAGKGGLSDWIVRSLSDGVPITLFSDVRFSPLHIASVCRYIEIAARARVAGVFNLGARGGVSKAEFGVSLAEQLGLPVEGIRIGKMEDVALKAKRPHDMTMMVGRFESAFNCALPEIADEMHNVAKDYGAT